MENIVPEDLIRPGFFQAIANLDDEINKEKDE